MKQHLDFGISSTHGFEEVDKNQDLQDSKYGTISETSANATIYVVGVVRKASL